MYRCKQFSWGNPSRHIKGPKVYVEKLIGKYDLIMYIVICSWMPASIKVKKRCKACMAGNQAWMQFILDKVTQKNWLNSNHLNT